MITGRRSHRNFNAPWDPAGVHASAERAYLAHGYAGFEASYAENSGYPGLRSTTSSTPTRVGWVVAQDDDAPRWGSIKIVTQGDPPVTILARATISQHCALSLPTHVGVELVVISPQGTRNSPRRTLRIRRTHGLSMLALSSRGPLRGPMEH